MGGSDFQHSCAEFEVSRHVLTEKLKESAFPQMSVLVFRMVTTPSLTAAEPEDFAGSTSQCCQWPTMSPARSKRQSASDAPVSAV
jgi:hypothetical protein